MELFTFGLFNNWQNWRLLNCRGNRLYKLLRKVKRRLASRSYASILGRARRRFGIDTRMSKPSMEMSITQAASIHNFKSTPSTPTLTSTTKTTQT